MLYNSICRWCGSTLIVLWHAALTCPTCCTCLQGPAGINTRMPAWCSSDLLTSSLHCRPALSNGLDLDCTGAPLPPATASTHVQRHAHVALTLGGYLKAWCVCAYLCRNSFADPGPPGPSPLGPAPRSIQRHACNTAAAPLLRGLLGTPDAQHGGLHGQSRAGILT